MKRNFVIDVYRVCLMFGICLLHAITQGGHNVSWAGNLLHWCVPGFMFISGWYGIKFSLGKVLKLYGISLYCSTVFVVFDSLVHPSVGCLSWSDCLLRVYKISIGQWFLNAYVVVMCLAPVINLAIERMTVKELYPLALLVFGWSFVTTLPISGFIPSSPGLTAYSSLTLLGVYIVARFFRRLYDEGGRFEIVSNKMVMLLILGVSLVMAAIGLGDYNSPFAVAIAGSVFFIFINLTVPSWLGKVCVWLGPSMFSIYLMHSHGYAWGYLKIMEDWLVASLVPMPFVYGLTAIVVFGVCLILDLPRRIIGLLVLMMK